jgi:hypothetical protein
MKLNALSTAEQAASLVATQQCNYEGFHFKLYILYYTKTRNTNIVVWQTCGMGIAIRMLG